jgi:hypothetical protein
MEQQPQAEVEGGGGFVAKTPEETLTALSSEPASEKEEPPTKPEVDPLRMTTEERAALDEAANRILESIPAQIPDAAAAREWLLRANLAKMSYLDVMVGVGVNQVIAEQLAQKPNPNYNQACAAFFATESTVANRLMVSQAEAGIVTGEDAARYAREHPASPASPASPE